MAKNSQGQGAGKGESDSKGESVPGAGGAVPGATTVNKLDLALYWSGQLKNRVVVERGKVNIFRAIPNEAGKPDKIALDRFGLRSIVNWSESGFNADLYNGAVKVARLEPVLPQWDLRVVMPDGASFVVNHPEITEYEESKLYPGKNKRVDDSGAEVKEGGHFVKTGRMIPVGETGLAFSDHIIDSVLDKLFPGAFGQSGKGKVTLKSRFPALFAWLVGQGVGDDRIKEILLDDSRRARAEAMRVEDMKDKASKVGAL